MSSQQIRLVGQVLCMRGAGLRRLPWQRQKGVHEGLDTVDRDGVLVFRKVGTVLKDGRHYTNGGRVLGIAALGSDREEARKGVSPAARVIFTGVQYRKDIAK